MYAKLIREFMVRGFIKTERIFIEISLYGILKERQKDHLMIVIFFFLVNHMAKTERILFLSLTRYILGRHQMQ